MSTNEFRLPSENFIESVKQGLENEVSKAENSVEKGRLFLKWILTEVFHATEDDAENGILDGPNDKGIDAILEIRGSEMNFFRIFQTKFGKSHSMDDLQAFKSKIEPFLKTNPNELSVGSYPRCTNRHTKKRLGMGNYLCYRSKGHI